MLNASAAPGTRILLHVAHPYKTTLPAMQHMGLDIAYADYNDAAALERSLRDNPPATVYLQHVPQQLGDRYDLASTIRLIRAAATRPVRIVVDDNYAGHAAARIGVQLGADASALSLFKLLAPDPIGVVLTAADTAERIRRDLVGRVQVQGPQAMAALRALAYTPVALAVQDAAVVAAAAAIDERVAPARCRTSPAPSPAQPGMRCVVVVFNRPVAEEFLRSAWRNGSPSQSVGEEAQFEFLPLFTYLTSTFLKAAPGLERWAVRINPLRGGPDTILRVLEAAVSDPGFRSAADGA